MLLYHVETCKTQKISVFSVLRLREILQDRLSGVDESELNRHK